MSDDNLDVTAKKRNEPSALKEIHDIRERIFEETKNMTSEERATHAHREAQTLIRQYNLKIRCENRTLS
jgi:hypothetical protein